MADNKKVTVPDIGGAENVDVIEVMIKEGDVIEKDQSLITLESDKATMEIPSPAAGKVRKVLVKTGDTVSEGSDILELEAENGGETSEKKEDKASETDTTSKDDKSKKDDSATEEKSNESTSSAEEEKDTSDAQKDKAEDKAKESTASSEAPSPDSDVHAGPAVRRMAHELGVNLSKVKGSGRKNRITKEDVEGYIKTQLAQAETGGGALAMPAAPKIDFSRFGEIESKPLNKIKRLTGENVHRSWVTIPHVTQFEDADITELEAFRKAEQEQAKKDGYKLTLLAFVTKALCQALKAFPQFNSSLTPEADALLYKKYFNIGIAVDTPNGLVVPVIKDVDTLSVADIAREMARLSTKAREKGLMPADMNGGCITISSLGGIGGTAFTPIVNSPEVAILGLSRSQTKPVWQKDKFIPRLMLPLSLSYDHRVIDGAEAARFTTYLAGLLGDIRRVLL